MTKKEFIDLANELLKEENLENREADLQLLRREFRHLTEREDETYSEAEETGNHGADKGRYQQIR